ncbi:AAA family ATPase [Candidatus Nomurabacteria bacterium]|uniref:AAA family ATPase n=1 Tax=candidate division WWE3 bacterium TaxID=2053526 RepID=A0A955IVT3_UNCKA|nr:AAA family ATPase [candidate division WWE3 bacterium]MCB9823825.1 AAA family ATPase [Candidatus Nomurabacteria bacterium]MCB9826769.1 AAA family ATPase [Candidatus Nomurabacteria bacterium]MCB9827620.1 AAA family ATPase [Candidatus Nomurabacteria bacterium]HXK52472.1 AAA family ATPase [bacterium]
MPDKNFSIADTPNLSAADYAFAELRTLSSLVNDTRDIPEDLKDRLNQMLDRLDRMAKLGHYAQEFDTLSRYIETIAEIPWGEKTKDNLDLTETKNILDKNHYGMEWVKERILEYLATIKLLKDRQKEGVGKSPVLLLVGLQGIGKTTLAMSVAEALGRKFIRISMGGIGSTLELRGRSKAYPEAEPGQIIKALIKTGVKNPVILLDEIEKASGESGLRSDIMAILLEILDPSQNNSFRDHYIDYPIDLSDVLFICSANNTGTITTALMDRLEIIKMPSYTDAEKATIAKDYLLPKVIELSGLKPEELEIDPALWPSIVRPFGFDSGIRSLSRTLEAICRKVAKEIVEGKTKKVRVDESNLKYYLPS